MSHDGHSHVTVEDLVLEHFALPEHGSWAGVHSEGGVWSTLFGILLWDVLFAPVPDVFRSRFQSAPLDLCTDAFAPARAEVMQSTLERIQRGGALDMLESTWEQHNGGLHVPMRDVNFCVWQTSGTDYGHSAAHDQAVLLSVDVVNGMQQELLHCSGRCAQSCFHVQVAG